MSFRDELVRCAACGNQFVYTVREQRKRSARGLPADPPPFCADCRGSDVRLSDGAVDEEFEESDDDQLTVDLPPAAGVSATVMLDNQAAAGRAAPESERAGGPRPHGPRRSGDVRGAKGGQGGPRHSRRSGGPESRQSHGRGRRKSEPPAQTELRVRQTGTVKWFDEDRGFGFIAQEDGEELFVHSTAVLVDARPALVQGQEVEFEVARTSRGAQAVDVVPLD